MPESERTANTGRRGFFRRVAALAGAAGAAILLRPRPAASASAVDDAPAEKRGYRITEHVRTYYRKARF
jgi:hypothetical protein